ncbi:uncharacterized protein G2W53_011859 [Senna tora]|uniref:Uncharacterized protein n=1 Tax=Senna tora TaxID=362788 RepID=A0A834U036_9FABA|nr:uncharacterized protein G2W53_011859 [Senna tora]
MEGMEIEHVCLICKKDTELVFHAIVGCDDLQQFWAGTNNSFVNEMEEVNVFMEWFNVALTQWTSKDLDLFAMATQKLWERRNKIRVGENAVALTEKQPKLKNKILKILPKAAAAVAVTFQNPPFSPGRDHKRPKNASRWSMIPDEARRKAKDGGTDIDSQEPTSPKISCMGQIKHKKKQIKKAKAKANKIVSMPKEVRPEVKNDDDASSTFRRMFRGGRKSDSAASVTTSLDVDKEGSLPDIAPRLSDMKRFTSGRNSLSDFDWKAQDYFSDQDRDESDAEEEEEEDFMIPFSAPILVGGGHFKGGIPPLQPKKEINLWKRRTMAPPRPLQLNPMFTAK